MTNTEYQSRKYSIKGYKEPIQKKWYVPDEIIKTVSCLIWDILYYVATEGAIKNGQYREIRTTFVTRDRMRTNETKDHTQKNKKMSTTNPQKHQVTFQQVVGKRRPKQTYRKHQVTFQQVVGKRRPKQTYRKHQVTFQQVVGKRRPKQTYRKYQVTFQQVVGKRRPKQSLQKTLASHFSISIIICKQQTEYRSPV